MKPFAATALAAFALGAPAAAQKPTNVVPITLYSFGYGPNPIVLKAGVPVTLVFTNRAGIGHEFSAPQFFKASKIVAGNPGGGDVDLKSGQSASITLVPAAGAYEVHCGHFLHTQMGMRTMLYVR
jgi:uncharacterized cupredoxin-like copper-binding protein